MVEKVLNQEQIDAMVRAARGGKTAPQEKNVAAWDARQAGQIGREQMRAIHSLHETFARSLTHSLGAYLRAEVQAALASAEHLPYGEFLQRIPEPAYLASLRLDPMAETAILQIDLSVAFTILDVLLGGEGKGAVPGRDISSIEEQILETLVHIIRRELDNAWQGLSLTFLFQQRLPADQVARLMPLEEKTLTLSFEITMSGVRGTFMLMVPAVVSNAMLRKISAGWAPARPKAQQGASARLRRLLLNCPFPLQLETEPAAVKLTELAQLAPGGMLVLGRRAEEPVRILIGGQPMFAAKIARRGAARAAQVLSRVSPDGDNIPIALQADASAPGGESKDGQDE